MAMTTRLVAVLGGGDWYDASVDHLMVPAGMDLRAERETYQAWLRSGFGARFAAVPYRDFPEWLVDRGARVATEAEVEVFEEEEP